MTSECSNQYSTSLVWFRRDLRIDDNPALVAALQSSRTVIPVFIWAPEEEGQFQPGRCSRWWLKQSLLRFEKQLGVLGSKLIIRRTDETSAVLLQLAQEAGAEAVFFNHLYDPISLVRDHEVKQTLLQAGVACRSYNSDLLYEPWEVLDDNQQPLTTFEGFWNRVVEMPYPPPFPLAAPTSMPPVPARIACTPLQDLDWFMTAQQDSASEQLAYKWEPGLEGAIKKMEAFLAASLPLFQHDRAKVDRESTSQLSPWIHQGTLSVRYIYYRVKQKELEVGASGGDIAQSCADFLQQMGYREYSRYLSFHFPFLHERSLLGHLRACPWNLDQLAFKAWKQGLTGYPLVDAGMRELWSTGWLHNRLRVVVASFMVKNLLLPWQWGLKHFWDALLDADLECDALGWQYVAGCMVDAHPFSYIMDLEAESRRFDPTGQYVRRWLPVLSRLPAAHIHAPWKAPRELLAAADVELGCNYPYPIISMEESRSQVDQAAAVIERCAVSGSAPAPYRPATEPLASTMDLESSLPPSYGSQQRARWPPNKAHQNEDGVTEGGSWGRSSSKWEDSEEVYSNTDDPISAPPRLTRSLSSSSFASFPTAASVCHTGGDQHMQAEGLAVPSISILSGQPPEGGACKHKDASGLSGGHSRLASNAGSNPNVNGPPAKRRHVQQEHDDMHG